MAGDDRNTIGVLVQGAHGTSPVLERDPRQPMSDSLSVREAATAAKNTASEIENDELGRAKGLPDKSVPFSGSARGADN